MSGFISQKYSSQNPDNRTGINLAHGVFEAIVMENKDALLMGRLAVYIPDLGGNVKDPQSWKTVRYASPFYGITPYRDTELSVGQTVSQSQQQGSISAADFRKVEGSGLAGAVDNLMNSGQQGNAQQMITSYGMWAVPPDLGVTVLVMFAGGDMNRGFWFACVPTVSHGMVPAIGAPDGKTPLAEFNPIDPQVPVTEDLASIQRQPYQPLVQQLTTQGLQEDPARGPITSSSFREAPSNVFGISSKAGHTFVMDDGDQGGKNKLIRLRTAGGNQITMNDDTGFVYIINAQGTGWIEVGASGQIDVYGAAGINLATNGDLNMHADKNVNIHAGECVKIVGTKASKIMGGEEMQIHGAKTMIEGVDSLHIHSCTEIIITSFQDIHVKAFNYMCQKAKCFLFNSCTAKEAEQVPPEQPNDVSGYQTTVARAPSKEPYKEHDGGGGTGGTQADGTGRPGGQSAPASGNGSVSSGPFTGGNAGVSGWWTPERQSYAADYLVKNAGLTQAGAAGLVARWTLEAPGGPTSVNPYSGASGIAQWLGSRKDAAATSGNFDQQLSKAALELNTTEKRAGDLLRNATDADSAARGATAYERAEYYNRTTNTDVLTKQTADRYNTVLGNVSKNKKTETTTVAADTSTVPKTSAAPPATRSISQTAGPGTSVASAAPTNRSTVINTPYYNGGGSGTSFQSTPPKPIVLQNAVKVTNTQRQTNNTTQAITSTYIPGTSAKPGQISVNTYESTPGVRSPSVFTGSTTISASSPAANQYLGRGGARPVGADPALSRVSTTTTTPGATSSTTVQPTASTLANLSPGSGSESLGTAVSGSTAPLDPAASGREGRTESELANPDQNKLGETPAQEASQALGQTGGGAPSSDIPAAPGGGNTGCFATGDNCERPVDQTGGGGPGGSPTAEPTGSGDTRGARNNNPGNIEDGNFAKSQPGYVGSDGRFAIFDTPENGAKAQQALLNSYISKGYNTPSKIINRWAPSVENDTNGYLNFVTKDTGFGANQVLNSSQMNSLAKSMAKMEIGANNVSKFYP